MGERVEGQLRAAKSLLAASQAVAARAQALDALRGARVRKDGHQEARATLLLSQADVLASRLRNAYHLSTAAFQRFSQLGDGPGAGDAAMVLSYSAASLGSGTLSMLAAEHCCELEGRGKLTSARQAAALNYLGVSAFWAGDHLGAKASLEAAVAYARELPAGGVFHPLVNLCFTEVLRVATSEDDTPAAAEELRHLVEQLQPLLHAQQCRSFNETPPLVGLVLSDFVVSYALLREKAFDEALRVLARYEAQASALPVTSWLHVLPLWTHSEHARLRRNEPAARRLARQLECEAQAREHGALAQLASRLQQRTG